MRSKLLAGIISVALLGLASCSSDEPLNDVTKQLPLAVQQDFDQRYDQAFITSFHCLPSGTQEINFTDKDNNQASTFYQDNEWQLCITRISNTELLPAAVQNGFSTSPYGKVQIEETERIERSGFLHMLYRICFRFPLKSTPNVTHEVLMNEDGKILHTFNHLLIDQRWFVRLEKEQLSFIQTHYADADIRAYLYESGYDTYFFIHEDILKQITFNNNNTWKETRYHLPFDTTLPPNVTDWLRKNVPDFHYTQVVYIESPAGSAYSLVDEDSEDKRGYIIGC